MELEHILGNLPQGTRLELFDVAANGALRSALQSARRDIEESLVSLQMPEVDGAVNFLLTYRALRTRHSTIISLLRGLDGILTEFQPPDAET